MMTQFFQVLKHVFGSTGVCSCFMMTQFFQVLKHTILRTSEYFGFYDDSILSGTKTDATSILHSISFMMTQFFQVLKRPVAFFKRLLSFMMTQFFQVLKPLLPLRYSVLSFMMTQFFQVLKLQKRQIRQ